MKRRVRPTLLLRMILTSVSLGVFVGAAALLGGRPLTFIIAIGLFLFWLLALEVGLLPMVLELAVSRWAEKRSGPPSSLWFVDVGAEDAAARAHERAGVKDNPALW